MSLDFYAIKKILLVGSILYEIFQFLEINGIPCTCIRRLRYNVTNVYLKKKIFLKKNFFRQESSILYERENIMVCFFFDLFSERNQDHFEKINFAFSNNNHPS